MFSTQCENKTGRVHVFQMNSLLFSHLTGLVHLLEISLLLLSQSHYKESDIFPCISLNSHNIKTCFKLSLEVSVTSTFYVMYQICLYEDMFFLL
jgi:hypothetical protein